MRKATLVLAFALAFAASSTGSAEDAWAEFSEPTETAIGPDLFNMPRFSFCVGVLDYHPKGAGTFEETFCGGGVGWDVVLDGIHTLFAEFELLYTETEHLQLDPVTQADNNIFRWGFKLGYMWSSWDRSLPPSELKEMSRYFRLGLGLNAVFSRQEYMRDVGVQDYEQLFDMYGGEAVLHLELGPRNVVSAFCTLRGGGGSLEVASDSVFGIGSRVHTAGVHAALEAGLLSQFTMHTQLKVGYRFETWRFLAEDLMPETDTRLNLLFAELCFPF